MQGHKQFTDRVVLRFRLSARVPKQNLYRRLAKLLDWNFLYQQTQALYSHTGQPSLNPVVFFKLMLVSQLENLVSDRRLVEHCSVRLDILYFLGYEVDEDLPWYSTISRTRHLFPAAVFEHLFNHVSAQCVAVGLVTGYTQAVDPAFVKANASLESLCEKQPAEVSAPVLQVASKVAVETPFAPPAALRASPEYHFRRVAAAHTRYARNDSGPLGRDRPQARLLSSKTCPRPATGDCRCCPRKLTCIPKSKSRKIIRNYPHGIRRPLPSGTGAAAESARPAHALAAAAYSGVLFWQFTPAPRDAPGQHKRPQ